MRLRKQKKNRSNDSLVRIDKFRFEIQSQLTESLFGKNLLNCLQIFLLCGGHFRISGFDQ